MIYLILFWEFLKIGLFAFGGAYGAIPLIRESVTAQGWMTETEFANMVALSESTPGPIMVNTATYIGADQAGIAGAAAATFGVILPSFILILLITVFLHKWLGHKYVQAVMQGIKPCLTGMIFATGLALAAAAVFGKTGNTAFDTDACILLVLLIAISVIYPRIRKKELSPILLIIISAVLGAVVF